MIEINLPDDVTLDIFTSEYIRSLIYSNYIRFNVLKDVFFDLNIDIIPNYVMTIIYDDFWELFVDDPNTMRYKSKKFLLDKTRELTRDYKAISTSLLGTDKVVLFIDYKFKNLENSETEILNFTENLKNNLTKETGHSVSIGLSNYCGNIYKISESYEESFRALENIFIKGDNSVIVGNKANIFSDSIELDITKLIQNLIIEIIKNDKENIEFLVSFYFEKLLKSNTKENLIKSTSLLLLSEISLYFSNILKINNSVILSEYISKIIKENTSDGVRDLVLTNLLEYNTLLHKSNIDYIEISKAYIDKYYMQNLNIDKMAEIIGYSNSYFSRLFKKTEGVGFSIYLQKVRIEKSKELILNKDKSLYDISEEVGFDNYSYYSKIFKDIEGISPREYKKLLRRSNLKS